jgi:pimeloyl-ACP methyl ester carboxylesterase
MTDLLSQSLSLPDGRRLTYAEYGAPHGAPVFYFHGLSGSRLEPGMLGDDDFASAGICLIAPDRPGMGGSDFQPGRGYKDWPADVLALADHLGLGKFGVFGVSGGGGYAAACARFIPERITAAVIASGAGPMDSPEARAGLPFMGRLVYWLASRSAGLTRLFLSLTRPRGMADVDKVRQQVKRSLPPVEAAVLEKPGRLEAFIASGEESMRQGLRGIAWDTHLCACAWDFRLEEINLQVRLLHGEADRNVPVAVARKISACIPGCQATFYPGEGHFSAAINHMDEVIKPLKPTC